MTFVISRLCRDCVDQACVDVCPVECIYEYTGTDKEKFPNQLYIDTNDCIDCTACEPECPWEAIFEDAALPEVFSDDLALNEAINDEENRAVPVHEDKPAVTPEQVEENKKKWNLST